MYFPLERMVVVYGYQCFKYYRFTSDLHIHLETEREMMWNKFPSHYCLSTQFLVVYITAKVFQVFKNFYLQFTYV